MNELRNLIRDIKFYEFELGRNATEVPNDIQWATNRATSNYINFGASETVHLIGDQATKPQKHNNERSIDLSSTRE